MEEQQDDHPAQAASVLQRKTSVGKAAHQARAMSLPKAFRLSLAKVADELCEMAMAVIGLRQQSVKGSDLEQMFEAHALLMLLDGPLQRRGAAVFDQSFVGGLIQQQTMGKVLPASDAVSRQLTATDAAMCAPFLDALLSRSATLPQVAAHRALIQGYQFGAHCEESRLLMMALERPEYEVFHLTVDMAGGARQGQIMLCFPACEASDDLTEEGAQKPDQANAGDAASRMERSVMALNVELNIALARMVMPLSAVQGFKVGTVLDLEVSSFDQAIVQTREGRRLSRGTLGQINGQRAVQLEHAPKTVNVPRRRISDRDALDLPQVSGDGTGTRPPPDAEIKQLTASLPASLPEAAEGADVQPVSVEDLSVMEGVAADAKAEEMPDLSDLPDFDTEGAKMSIT